ncbi:ATP-binding protein [Cystobacter fuscus]|uniref:ATP-binding protein n=1 Tax=Cystobacter fuscus TaxID=43 RepID=UPI0012FDB492|nr:ATP-binding protein [Cystobacter fuscus]
MKLEELGPINVIHGPNNVGKSNLLQAIQVFFALVGTRLGDWLPVGELSVDVSTRLKEMGFEPTEIFNLESPKPITLKTVIETDEDELLRAGLETEADTHQASIEIELRREVGNVLFSLKSFVLDDYFDVVSFKLRVKQQGAHPAIPTRDFLRQFLSFLTWNPLFQKQQIERFALIDVERLPSSELALKLYDAKESPELEQARRWEKFLDAMSAFSDILGDGMFIAIYDRHKNKANLSYQTSFARMPLHLLGSGVQQCVSLVGLLLMTNATIVSIEEPELNLRYSLQERLRDVFKQKLVGVLGGPSQIFLTSHSPAFESGPFFYQMERTPKGPVVTKRKVEQARLAVGFPQEVTPPGMNAANCYLSTDGIVRVPERIRQVLGLPNGGGVMFLERENRVEMLSDEQFAMILDEEPGDDGDEQS